MGEIWEVEITSPPAVDQPTAEVADALSRELDIPHNMMFMGSPRAFPFKTWGGSGLSGDLRQPGPSLSIS